MVGDRYFFLGLIFLLTAPARARRSPEMINRSPGHRRRNYTRARAFHILYLFREIHVAVFFPLLLVPFFFFYHND